MKVTFKTGSEANYGSTNGEMFFASDTKQLLLNGIKYIPKKLSELTNDSGFLTSITKSMVENVLTGNITSHTHNYLPLSGGTLTGNLTCNGSYINMSGTSGTVGYRGYFNNSQSNRANGSHIFQSSGLAYGENATSIGYSAYAGIRNTDSDSGTYPYLHWQWMDCLQVKETTSGTAVNCYGAILTNAGGNKDTATFSLCIGDACVTYGMAGNSEELNNFLSFTNTSTSYGRVVVYIADNKSGDANERIFAGTTSRPRSQSNVKIGNVLLGQGCNITNVASMSVNDVTVYRIAFYFWNKRLSASYDITQKTTAMVCTKVNNTNYSGASSYASGHYSVASGSYSVASGSSSVASGHYSVASGNSSVASGISSVASGNSSVASGSYSVASGYYSVASGYSSVASGYYSVAKHEGSKVYALRGVSGRAYQTVLGRDNVETSAASVVVGWGSSDAARKNIFVLDTAGNATFGDGGAATVTAANFNGTAASLGMETIKMYATSTNEINFGGTSIRDTIYFGYRSMDSRPTPTAYNFGNGKATIMASTFTGNAATATKLANQRKITIGGASEYFDGSKDISFDLSDIMANSSSLALNVGSITTQSSATIREGLTVNGDISGELANKLNITLGSTTTTYDNTDNKSINITPSAIGAADASHTHSYLPLTGGTLTGDLILPYNKQITTGGLVIDHKYSSEVNNIIYKNNRINPSANGWADEIIIVKSSTDDSVFRFGVFGEKNELSYSYLGTNSYNGNNFRIYSDKLAFGNNVIYHAGNLNKSIIENVLTGNITSHTHTFASITSKPTTLGGYGITDAYTKTETNTELGKYLPLTGGTLDGALTVPKLTSTGGIVLGDSSLSAMVGSIGIQRYDETGFIGFLKDFNLGNSFNGVVLGWDGNYSLQENSVRIDASTFTYKGNNVWHSGNLKLGYISSGLLRAVQKDSSNNLYVVAPSLFEQGISNNYPKNLRWITEDEGQLVFDTEETAGTPSTVQVSIPVANGTSKGFMKSISSVTDVTGYTPCPVKSGTPYYKLDAIELDYTDFFEIGSGSIEDNLSITNPWITPIPIGGSLEYLLNYGVNNIPRLLTIDLGGYWKYFFWLQQTDDDSSIVAYYHCQFNDLWIVIDSPNREIRISQGGF